AGCRHVFRPVARKHAWRACSLLAQRVSREAARGPAPARAQGLSRHARWTVPTRTHGAALGKGPAEEGAVTFWLGEYDLRLRKQTIAGSGSAVRFAAVRGQVDACKTPNASVARSSGSKTARCSWVEAASPPISHFPACWMRRSCAARTLMRPSAVSTPAPRVAAQVCTRY